MEFLAGLHPKIIHFPIVLLLVYVVLEILSAITKKEAFSKAAQITIILGVVTTLFAVLTGHQAEEIASKWEDAGARIPFKLIGEHEEFANITLWYFAGLLVIRTVLVLKKKFTITFKYIFVLLALVGYYFVYQVGDHGGKLVYKHGVGTEIIKPEIKSKDK
ncbi:MAG: hypothetical protein COW08_08365 [Ignavibacteriales bacterium CG12_big_fil_rev_8_21_14_0_65_30_8]|nr:MAG: hypothetical protein COW08_08365 [Ignavibacteriales bacterium CG12_big_fil_rev_8_21_14_0_65_30_8]